jgi:hypothetical protein
LGGEDGQESKRTRLEISYPVWSREDAQDESAFHTQVRLPQGREGLLVDTGAVSNLMGENWLSRAAKLAADYGQGTEIKQLQDAKDIGGVGSGNSKCTHHATVPIALPNGDVGSFEANVIPGSDVPALLGLKSMVDKHTLLDLRHKRLMFVGPGGYDLTLSPGSRAMKMENSPSGHLLLPATEWQIAKAESNDTALVVDDS